VAKSIQTKVDVQLLGLSGAAGFLGCDGRTVSRHADARRLPCVRDSSGKRLFKRSDLKKFKRTHRIGNQCRAVR
jgi:hypothetical protein